MVDWTMANRGKEVAKNGARKGEEDIVNFSNITKGDIKPIS